MRTKKAALIALVIVPLALASVSSGQTPRQRESENGLQVKAAGYTCPLTGEELPCPGCCPLHKKK